VDEYEVLVAGWSLRDRDFALKNAPLLIQTGCKVFSQDLLRQAVLYGLEYVSKYGKLLPKPCILADAPGYLPRGEGTRNLERILQGVYAIPLEGQERVQERLYEACQSSLAQDLLHTFEPRGASTASLLAFRDELSKILSVASPEDNGLLRLSEGFTRLPQKGRQISLGLPALDGALYGGLGLGQSGLLYGQTGIGKSTLIHHIIRKVSLEQRLGTCLLTCENSQAMAWERMVRGAMVWTKEEFEEMGMPKADHLFKDRWGDPPLILVYRAPGQAASINDLRTIVDQSEQKLQERVLFFSVDHSKDRIASLDWQTIVTGYGDVRTVCGEKYMIGMDVAHSSFSEKGQERIQYRGLRDGTDLCLRMKKFERSQLECTIDKAREGVTGGKFYLRVDYRTGQLTDDDYRFEQEE